MKDTKVRNLIIIAVCLIVLFPVIRYIDNLPSAEEVKRQEERQEEERQEQKEEEARLKEKEEETQKKAEQEARWEEEAKIRREKQAKKDEVEGLADKVNTFFNGCSWESVTVTEQGNVYLEDYNNDYSDNTEIKFNITQARFKIDEDKVLYAILGKDIKEVCPSGDHTIFLKLLQKFKETVTTDILEE